MIGTDLRLLVANALALEFLGLPGQPEDWIDRPLQDVLVALRRLTPAIVRMVLAEIRRLRRGDELPGEGEGELHARTQRIRQFEAQSLTPEQIRGIKEHAFKVSQDLETLRDDFEGRRQFIELLM